MAPVSIHRNSNDEPPDRPPLRIVPLHPHRCRFCGRPYTRPVGDYPHLYEPGTCSAACSLALRDGLPPIDKDAAPAD